MITKSLQVCTYVRVRPYIIIIIIIIIIIVIITIIAFVLRVVSVPYNYLFTDLITFTHFCTDVFPTYLCVSACMYVCKYICQSNYVVLMMRLLFFLVVLFLRFLFCFD